MSIPGDYWKIAKKATDALEAEFEKLKAAKISEIKKEILYDFIDMHKDYLNIYDVGVVNRDGKGYDARKMYSIGSEIFYDNVGRKFYTMTDNQLYNWDPVSVRNFELTISEEGIDIILKFIERKLEDYIN